MVVKKRQLNQTNISFLLPGTTTYYFRYDDLINIKKLYYINILVYMSDMYIAIDWISLNNRLSVPAQKSIAHQK